MRFAGKIILGAIALFLGLIFYTDRSIGKQKPLALCTTTIIADAVEHVAGEHFTIRTLMGPGVDPHLYRARESDVTALSAADIIFYNGLHLEGKMGTIFDRMQTYAPTIAVGEIIPIEDRIESEFAAIYDPHIWHDVCLFKQLIAPIVSALSHIDPQHAQEFEQNGATYMQELDRLHGYVLEQIDRIPKDKRILVTAHDAFAYFGKRYGIEVVGLQGISTDAQVSVKDIHDAVATIVACQIPAIFLESSIPMQSICAVQHAVQAHGMHVTIAPELYSDSLGDKSTTAYTYCGMIKHNIDVIVSALS